MKAIPVISMISAIASFVPVVLQFRKNRKDRQSRKKRALSFAPGRTDSVRQKKGVVACLRSTISGCIGNSGENQFRRLRLTDEGTYIIEVFSQPKVHMLGYISTTYEIGRNAIPAFGMIAAIVSLVPMVLPFRKNRKDRQSRKKRPLFFVPNWSNSDRNWTGEVANLKRLVSACLETPEENPLVTRILRNGFSSGFSIHAAFIGNPDTSKRRQIYN